MGGCALTTIQPKMHRPSVIGRKSLLFCDSVAGAKASTSLYSLIETAKANGVEPYRYLRTVFTELSKANSLEDIEALLPFEQKPAYDEALWIQTKRLHTVVILS